MSHRPDPEELSELGESTTNVSNAWAGAETYLTQGIVAWTRQQVSHDQRAAVNAAVAACRLVIDRYPATAAEGAGHAPKSYLDDLLAKVQRWLDNPSHTNKEAVRSALDPTRQVHAWQGHADDPSFWILEAVDHASLAVWAGERRTYIVPLDFGTCAARSIACVLHAMLVSGETEARAVDQLTSAVVGARQR